MFRLHCACAIPSVLAQIPTLQVQYCQRQKFAGVVNLQTFNGCVDAVNLDYSPDAKCLPADTNRINLRMCLNGSSAMIGRKTGAHHSLSPLFPLNHIFICERILFGILNSFHTGIQYIRTLLLRCTLYKRAIMLLGFRLFSSFHVGWL